jgi:hypothetical protein
MKKVKTRINITTSRNGTDAPSPKHFVIATMGSSEALHDVEISALDTAAAIRAAREGFEVSLENQHPVGGFDAKKQFDWHWPQRSCLG